MLKDTEQQPITPLEQEQKSEVSGSVEAFRGMKWLHGFLLSEFSDPTSALSTQISEAAAALAAPESIDITPPELEALYAQAQRILHLCHNLTELFGLHSQEEKDILLATSHVYARNLPGKDEQDFSQSVGAVTPGENFLETHATYLRHFLGTLSHDIIGSRGLMNIIGWVEMQRDLPDNSEIKAVLLEVLQDYAANNVAVLSHYDLEHPLPTPMAASEAVTIIQEAVASRERSQRAGIPMDSVLKLSVQDSRTQATEGKLLLSDQMFEQILNNMISNAVKAMETVLLAGENKIISIEVTVNDQGMTVGFVDSGPGFPQQFLKDDLNNSGSKEVAQVANYILHPAELKVGQTAWERRLDSQLMQIGTGLGLVTLQSLLRELGITLTAGTFLEYADTKTVAKQSKHTGIVVIEFPFTDQPIQQ